MEESAPFRADAMRMISRGFEQNHGAYKLCIFYRGIAALYYPSAHYSKGMLRQLIT